MAAYEEQEEAMVEAARRGWIAKTRTRMRKRTADEDHELHADAFL